MADLLNVVRVWETTTDETSPFDLDGISTAEKGLRTFVGAGVAGSPVLIMEQHQTQDEWQLSRATITDATPDTYVINKVIKSSNSDAQVVWTAGTRDVFLLDYHGYSPGPQHTITGATTLDESHHTVLCNFGSDLSVTLPPVADYAGKEYVLASMNSGGIATITDDAGDTNAIEMRDSNFAGTLPLTRAGEAVRIRSDGIKWRLLSAKSNLELGIVGQTTVVKGHLEAQQSLHYGALITSSPVSTSQSVDLDASCIQFVDLTSASGPFTLTFSATASQVRAVTVLVKTHATPFAITLAAGTGITAIRKLGTEPDWANLHGAKIISLNGTFDGTDLELEFSPQEDSSLPLPRGYIDGLDTSRASATTISVAVGEARDDADTDNIVLAATITKTEAAWAVGNNNGGLDGTETVSGTYDNDTWYYVYLIKRQDTGVVDVLFSESKTTPTLPTNYDVSRLIGMFFHQTGGSTDIRLFQQSGDYFYIDPAALQALSDTSPPTTWTALDLSAYVPPIAGLIARGWAILRKTDTADVKCGFQTGLVGTPTNVWDGEIYMVNMLASSLDELTQTYALAVDASGQLQYRASTASDIRIQVYVSGWIWSRGKG